MKKETEVKVYVDIGEEKMKTEEPLTDKETGKEEEAEEQSGCVRLCKVHCSIIKNPNI